MINENNIVYVAYTWYKYLAETRHKTDRHDCHGKEKKEKLVTLK